MWLSNQRKSGYLLSDDIAWSGDQSDGHERAVPRRIGLADGYMGNAFGDELLLDSVEMKLIPCRKRNGVSSLGNFASAAFPCGVDRLSHHDPHREVRSDDHIVSDCRGACGAIGRPLDSLTVMLDSSCSSG